MLQLPITRIKVSDLIKAGNPNDVLSGMTAIELASVIVLQKTPSQKHKPINWAQKVFEDLLEITKSTDTAQIALSIARNVDAEVLEKVMQARSSYEISIQEDGEIIEEDFISNGKWITQNQDDVEDLRSYEHLGKVFGHSNRFTPDQGRVLSEYLANPEDSITLEGYAGSGKTRCVSHIVDILDEKLTLICAMNFAQLESLTSKLNKKVASSTFGQLATKMIGEIDHKSRRQNYDRSKRTYVMHADEVAKKMGYQHVGTLTPIWVAQNVSKTVSKFCYSGDKEINLKHVPKSYYLSKDQDREKIAAYAVEFWNQTMIPIPGDKRPLPSREYHRIKHLSLLEDITLTTEYQFLLFDEAHDLPEPVVQILDRSPQVVISLGDSYQSLTGQTNLDKANRKVRHRQLAYSFRAGDNASSLYNDILDLHPKKVGRPFEGAKTKKTNIIYYDQFEIPDKPCTIVSKSSWQIFVLLQKFAHTGAKFHILPRTLSDVKYLLGEAIELYHGRIARPTHPFLRFYSTWELLLTKQKDPVLPKIDNLFSRGFEANNLEESLSRSAPTAENAYVIGRIEDAKNMEFDRVVLAEDTVGVGVSDKYDQAALINHIYTGISRAKHEIYLPGYTKDWLTDHLKSKNAAK